MLREHIRAGDDLGRAIQDGMRAGKLVSDESVNQLVFERIQQPDAKRVSSSTATHALRPRRRDDAATDECRAGEVVIHLSLITI